MRGNGSTLSYDANTNGINKTDASIANMRQRNIATISMTSNVSAPRMRKRTIRRNSPEKKD